MSAENFAEVSRRKSDRPDFIPGLAMSRGIAALMVAMLHCSQATYFDAAGHKLPLIAGPKYIAGASVSSTLLRVVGNGHGAVVVFFVLSGFVLTMMLQRWPQEFTSSARAFFIGRIFRIYPAIVATLLLFTAVFALTGRTIDSPDAFNALNILRNALLIHTDIDGVMWSLQIEMLAAPLIFLAYRAWLRFGDAALIAPFLLLAGLSFSPAWAHPFGPQPDLSCLYSFIAGMIACIRGKALVERTGRSGVLLTIAIAGFAAARPVLGWWSNWSVIFETLFSGAIIAVIAYGTFRWRGGLALAALARYYGRISYSFYLIHPLTLAVLWHAQTQLGAAIAAGIPPELVSIALFIASTAVITPVAHLQCEWVERAGIAFGRKLQWPRSNKVLTSPARSQATNH